MYALYTHYSHLINEYTQHTIIEEPEGWKDIPKLSLLPPDQTLWFILSGSNYLCLEQICIVPKMFEPMKFDYITKAML